MLDHAKSGETVKPIFFVGRLSRERANYVRDASCFCLLCVARAATTHILRRPVALDNASNFLQKPWKYANNDDYGVCIRNIYSSGLTLVGSFIIPFFCAMQAFQWRSLPRVRP